MAEGGELDMSTKESNKTYRKSLIFLHFQYNHNNLRSRSSEEESKLFQGIDDLKAALKALGFINYVHYDLDVESIHQIIKDQSTEDTECIFLIIFTHMKNGCIAVFDQLLNISELRDECAQEIYEQHSKIIYIHFLNDCRGKENCIPVSEKFFVFYAIDNTTHGTKTKEKKVLYISDLLKVLRHDELDELSGSTKVKDLLVKQGQIMTQEKFEGICCWAFSTAKKDTVKSEICKFTEELQKEPKGYNSSKTEADVKAVGSSKVESPTGAAQQEAMHCFARAEYDKSKETALHRTALGSQTDVMQLLPEQEMERKSCEVDEEPGLNTDIFVKEGCEERFVLPKKSNTDFSFKHDLIQTLKNRTEKVTTIIVDPPGFDIYIDIFKQIHEESKIYLFFLPDFLERQEILFQYFKATTFPTCILLKIDNLDAEDVTTVRKNLMNLVSAYWGLAHIQLVFLIAKSAVSDELMPESFPSTHHRSQINFSSLSENTQKKVLAYKIKFLGEETNFNALNHSVSPLTLGIPISLGIPRGGRFYHSRGFSEISQKVMFRKISKNLTSSVKLFRLWIRKVIYF